MHRRLQPYAPGVCSPSCARGCIPIGRRWPPPARRRPCATCTTRVSAAASSSSSSSPPSSPAASTAHSSRPESRRSGSPLGGASRQRHSSAARPLQTGPLGLGAARRTLLYDHGEPELLRSPRGTAGPPSAHARDLRLCTPTPTYCLPGRAEAQRQVRHLVGTQARLHARAACRPCRLGGATARHLGPPGAETLPASGPRHALQTSRRAAQGPTGGCCSAVVRPGQSRRFYGVHPQALPTVGGHCRGAAQDDPLFPRHRHGHSCRGWRAISR